MCQYFYLFAEHTFNLQLAHICKVASAVPKMLERTICQPSKRLLLQPRHPFAFSIFLVSVHYLDQVMLWGAIVAGAVVEVVRDGSLPISVSKAKLSSRIT